MIEINRNAPVTCYKKIIINANSVDVWKVLTEIDKWPEWQSDIKKARINGPLEAGTEFDWTSVGLKIHSRIHIVKPYVHFGWTGKGLWMYAIHNWKVVELNKQTEVIVEESMEGILARLLKIILKKALEKSMVKWLELLKKECETGSRFKNNLT